jgi:hypothetical protein
MNPGLETDSRAPATKRGRRPFSLGRGREAERR